MTERMGSRTQAALMTFFRRMTGPGFKGKLKSVETLDKEPPGYFLLKRTHVEVQEHAMWIIYFHLAWESFSIPWESQGIVAGGV